MGRGEQPISRAAFGHLIAVAQSWCDPVGIFGGMIVLLVVAMGAYYGMTALGEAAGEMAAGGVWGGVAPFQVKDFEAFLRFLWSTLGMIVSRDQISKDRRLWLYLRQSCFWHSLTRAIRKPTPRAGLQLTGLPDPSFLPPPRN